MRHILTFIFIIPFAFAAIACDDDSTSNTCTPVTEICGDGIDNDCDGVIDNGCNDCVPEEEVCDGVDNNCDGQVDEDLTRPCSSACGGGTEVCVNGAWVNCTAQEPATEVCDGVDNDCDGEIDNGTDMECPMGSTRTCGSDVGECNSGTELCDNTCNWSGECLGETAAATEECDGLDNNCDGIIDDGCTCTPGDTQACGTDEGECSVGLQTCEAGGVWGTTCDGEVTATTEICDGLDNDCDGTADNNILNMMEGASVNDTCSQATMYSEMSEGDYGIIADKMYKGDLSDDIDYFKLNILEFSDAACILHPTYNECHEYEFTVLDDAGLPLEFDVIFTNLTYDDVPADRLAMCENEPAGATYHSDASGIANIKMAGDCLTDMDWEVYIKVYSSTGGYSCSDYQIDIWVGDASPSADECGSEYIPY